MNIKIDYKPNKKQTAAHIAAQTHRNVLYLPPHIQGKESSY